MDRGYIVVTAVGPDRPGIVEDLAAFVSGEKGNIEESKAAVLGGEFAVIMLISGSRVAIDALAGKLPALGENLGLSCSSKRTRAGVKAKGRPYLVETVSIDTPGIVHSVTAVLRKHGANIEELETDTSGAPWTGAPLFRMRARITLAEGGGLSSLRSEFDALQREKDLDISIKPLVQALPE